MELLVDKAWDKANVKVECCSGTTTLLFGGGGGGGDPFFSSWRYRQMDMIRF